MKINTNEVLSLLGDADDSSVQAYHQGPDANTEAIVQALRKHGGSVNLQMAFLGLIVSIGLWEIARRFPLPAKK